MTDPLRLPLQPEGVTLRLLVLGEARGEVRAGYTVIIGDGLQFALRGAERAVAGYADSCARCGWSVLREAHSEREEVS